MVTLPRCVFKRGGNVSGFKQRKIGKDLLTAGASGEQIENVPDADAKTPQTRPAATLGGINGNSMGFAHVGLGASQPVPLITLAAANGNSDDFNGKIGRSERI
jgi:hypothetical protein